MKNTAAKTTGDKVAYGFVRTVPMTFDEVVECTRDALLSEGFGVLSETRMDEKFKEKLGVDFRKYVILGTCNPPLVVQRATLRRISRQRKFSAT